MYHFGGHIIEIYKLPVKSLGVDNSAFGGAEASVAPIKILFSWYTFSFRRYIN